MRNALRIPLAVAFIAALLWLVGIPTPASAEQSNCINGCAVALGLCNDSATTVAQVNACADAYDCCMQGCGQPVPNCPCGDGH
jgi:hypothetical protein